MPGILVSHAAKGINKLFGIPFQGVRMADGFPDFLPAKLPSFHAGQMWITSQDCE
jgi:hypothetical protein